MVEYRRLSKGEIVQEGDEIDDCVDAWRDDPVWKPAKNIGEPAPDPQYPAHRQYRRPVAPPCRTTRKLAMDAENAIFEALALSGEPISKDTETWLNAAAMLVRRAIESI
ncbi:MAG TPA: hypothetical protein DDW52_19970 [Planctomycetaceae bacterium]|nr:hypothetical protein [Planctomycetaceae bacterium]